MVLVLLIVVVRRWPPAYSVFAAATLAAAVSTTNLESFERYTLVGAFPFVLALASITRDDRFDRGIVALAAAGLVAYATLAFLNVTVP